MSERKYMPKILLNSVPKSGTHLLMQIILGIPGIKFKKAALDSFVFHDGIHEKVKTLENGDLGIGHLAYNMDLIAEINKNCIKHIFISRDLRDVTVSYMHFIMNQYPDHILYPYFTKFLETNEQRIQALISGVQLSEDDAEKYGFSTYPNILQEFEKIYKWRGSQSLCEIKYEALVEDEKSQKQEILKIIEYLWDDLQQLELTKATLYDLMKKSINPETCWTFRQGKIGGWKEIFTEDHKKTFKDNAGNFLIENGYEQDNNW